MPLMTDTTGDRVALRDLVQAYAEGCDTRDPALLRRWASWDARFGILPARPDTSKLFDTSLAP